MNIRLVVFT